MSRSTSSVAPPSSIEQSHAECTAPDARTRRESRSKQLDERTLLRRWTSARDERARAMLVRHYAPLTRSSRAAMATPRSRSTICCRSRSSAS